MAYELSSVTAIETDGKQVLYVDDAVTGVRLWTKMCELDVSTDDRFATAYGGGRFQYGTSHEIGVSGIHPAIYFQKWDPDQQTANPRTVTLTGNMSYTGRLGRNPYTATVSPGEGGSGGGSHGYSIRVENDDQEPKQFRIDLSSEWPAKKGYYITSWSQTGAVGTYQPYMEGAALVIPLWTYGDFTISPSWAPKTYTVTFDKQSGSGGTNSASVSYGGKVPNVTVPSWPNTDYVFGGYYTSAGGAGSQYVNASGIGSKDWDIDSDTTLYAYWKLNTRSLTIQTYDIWDGQMYRLTAYYKDSNDSTWSSVWGPNSGGGYWHTFNFAYGHTAQAYAVAPAGCQLDSPYDVYTAANPATYQMTDNKTFTPTMSRIKYNVSVYSNDTNKGTVAGGGSYKSDTTVTVTASPTNTYWYKFLRWDGTYQSNSNPYQFTASQNTSLTATFWSTYSEYAVDYSTTVSFTNLQLPDNGASNTSIIAGSQMVKAGGWPGHAKFRIYGQIKSNPAGAVQIIIGPRSTDTSWSQMMAHTNTITCLTATSTFDTELISIGDVHTDGNTPIYLWLSDGGDGRSASRKYTGSLTAYVKWD